MRKQNTKAWKTDFKPPKHDPLKVNCFKCNKEFEVKYITSRKRYSLKNNWEYWTEESEEPKNKQICSNCLINFFKNEKQLFWEKVKDPKKRVRLNNYLVQGLLVAD